MEWLIYLLKVSACMALFYAFYHWFLQKLTFFGINRTYLLSTLIISLIIPAMQLQIKTATIQQTQVVKNSAFHTNTFTNIPNAEVIDKPFVSLTSVSLDALDWGELLFAAYLLIAIFMLLVFAFQVLQLLKHTRHLNQKIGRLKVVFKREGFTNCSFLNYVFINQQALTEEEMAVILQHENVHVSHYHSVDKLLMSAFKALLWFNPLIYLYDKALEQVHEYEADKEASMTIGDTSYASLLLAIAVRTANPSIVHSFVQNPLKGRIKMLFTNQSKNMKKLTYLAVLPIGLALTWTFAVQVVYANHTFKPAKPTLRIAPAIQEMAWEPVTPINELKADYLPADKPQTDTLRMIDNPMLGKNPEVIIDGKPYGADILTKISPRCTNGIITYQGKIEITTINNKVEYATAIDRENVRTRNKATALGKFYVRYQTKDQDGIVDDEIRITMGKSSGTVGMPKGAKFLFLVNGKLYTEEQLEELNALPAAEFKNFRHMKTTDLSTNAELNAKYGKEYSALIEISDKEHTDEVTKEVNSTKNIN